MQLAMLCANIRRNGTYSEHYGRSLSHGVLTGLPVEVKARSMVLIGTFAVVATAGTERSKVAPHLLSIYAKPPDTQKV
jgi:hypothetical protein